MTGPTVGTEREREIREIEQARADDAAIQWLVKELREAWVIVDFVNAPGTVIRPSPFGNGVVVIDGDGCDACDRTASDGINAILFQRSAAPTVSTGEE